MNSFVFFFQLYFKLFPSTQVIIYNDKWLLHSLDKRQHLSLFLLCLLSQMRWVLLASKLPNINIIIKNHNIINQGCTICCILASGMRENGERRRKWRGNGERMRKWRGNGERFTLYISSVSLYFLPLYPFPISKIVIFCRKMLNTTLVSRMSQ